MCVSHNSEDTGAETELSVFVEEKKYTEIDIALQISLHFVVLQQQ